MNRFLNVYLYSNISLLPYQTSSLSYSSHKFSFPLTSLTSLVLFPSLTRLVLFPTYPHQTIPKSYQTSSLSFSPNPDKISNLNVFNRPEIGRTFKMCKNVCDVGKRIKMKLLSRTFHSFYNSIKFTYNTETFCIGICYVKTERDLS